MDDAVLSSGSAARILGISPQTLRRAVQRGALTPSQRTPGGHARFRRADLEAYARATPRHMLARQRTRPDPGIDGLLATLSDPAWVCDRHTLRVLAVNDAAVRHYGYTRAEFLSQPITAIPSPAARAPLGDDSGVATRPWHHHTKGGRLLPVVISTQTVTYASRPATLVLARDLTAALDAAQGEERVHVLAMALPLPTAIWQQNGDDWTLVAYNDAAYALTGGSIAALQGQPARTLVADQPAALADFVHWARDGRPVQREMSWRFGTTGRDAVLGVTVLPVPPDLVLVQMDDVTARRRAAENAAATLERLEATLDSIGDAVVAVDRSWRLTYVNAAAERLAGRRRGEMLGHLLQEVFTVDAPDAAARLQSVLEGEGPHHYQTYDASLGRWLDVSLYPAADGLSIYVRDVTAHKRVERARAVTDAGRAAVLHATDADDLLQRVCAAIVQTGGYRLAWVGLAEDRPGWPVRVAAAAGPAMAYVATITVSWADDPAGRGPTGRAIRTGQPQVLRDLPRVPAYAPWRAGARTYGFAASMALPLHVGERVIGALNVYATEPDAFDAAEQDLLSGLAADVAFGLAARQAERERSVAVAALRASEERYRTIVETAQEGIWGIDAAGQTTVVNEKMAALLGYTVSEMQGTVYLDYLKGADRQAAWERLVRRRTTPWEQERYEVRMRRKDGRELWCLVAVTVLTDERGAYAGGMAMVTDITARKEAEDALRRSEGLFRTLWMHLTDSIIILNPDGSYRYISPSHERLLGRRPAEIQGQPLTAHLHPDDAAWAGPRLAAVLRTPGAVETVEVRYRHADGSWRWIESIGANHTDDPAVGGIIIHSRDITARKEAEDTLRASEERFRALSEQASDLVALLDRDGVIRYASPAHRLLLGYDPATLEGTDAFARMHPDDVPRVRALVINNLRGGGTGARYEYRYRHADGSWRTLEASGVNRLDDPAVRGFIVNSRDVTERKQAEEALAHQALHDSLTGLPNRTLLTDRLERAVVAAHRGQAPVALLLLDLDRFKEVNDTFGHHHGDLLLHEVARRLSGLVRETDTVARLGGDEFAVVLPEADTAGAVRVAHQIITALDTAFALDGYTIHAGASIGIALYPMHGADVRTLMRRADVAMYLAKRTQSGYAVYDAAQDQHSPQRIALVTALRQAIPADGLLLHYQPQLDLVNGPPGVPSQRDQRRVVAVEALVRWRHPERGLIPPDEFIPLAEGTGLIKGLTERVLALALAQCRAWQQAGVVLPIAVNLSAWNLRDPHLVQTVAALLRAHEVPPAWLRLEMTESAIMGDTERAVAVLSDLVALGVRVSVDDYGTGYSSLAYLKRLPVDELKIDKSFVRDMARDETDAAIVRSTVGLAHTLGLRAVAEGVEDDETWAQLVAMGCDAAQGYAISRPVSATDLERWLGVTGETSGGRDARR